MPKNSVVNSPQSNCGVIQQKETGVHKGFTYDDDNNYDKVENDHNYNDNDNYDDDENDDNDNDKLLFRLPQPKVLMVPEPWTLNPHASWTYLILYDIPKSVKESVLLNFRRWLSK